MRRYRLRQFFKHIGPGVVTGAADDDPSGIATYLMAGAHFGYFFLWSALFTWPLMAVVQMACARIGFIDQSGLAYALKKKLPLFILLPICFALFIANSLNIAADLAAMADGVHLFLPIPYHFLVIVFAFIITYVTVFFKYQQINRILKWLCFFLLSYIFVAIIVKPNWTLVLTNLLTPHIPNSTDQWKMLVALLGTTISPYLFFWQASQEVEEQHSLFGKKILNSKQKEKIILFRRADVAIGTFFSNAVMMFVILSAALTLNEYGLTNITTSKEAAQALRPIAGSYASVLFTLGIVGVGLLAIPTLTGSAAYALAEALNWKKGLDLKFNQAKLFYMAIMGSTLIAVAIDFTTITPLQALYGSAVINGLLAPFLLLLLLWLIMDRKYKAPLWMKFLLTLTMLMMFGAAIGMFI